MVVVCVVVDEKNPFLAQVGETDFILNDIFAIRVRGRRRLLRAKGDRFRLLF